MKNLNQFISERLKISKDIKISKFNRYLVFPYDWNEWNIIHRFIKDKDSCKEINIIDGNTLFIINEEFIDNLINELHKTDWNRTKKDLNEYVKIGILPSNIDIKDIIHDLENIKLESEILDFFKKFTTEFIIK